MARRLSPCRCAWSQSPARAANNRAPGGPRGGNAGQSRWTLTSPNLTKVVFNGSGYLIEVHDSSGNKVVVHRDVQGRIDYVKTAADTLIEDPPSGTQNRLEFLYSEGRLDRIREGTKDEKRRDWVFAYAAGR